MRPSPKRFRAGLALTLASFSPAIACSSATEPDAGVDTGPADIPDSGTDAWYVPPPPVTCEGEAFDADARILLWGDLHVHTSLSFDAYFFNALNDPDRAYAFARGDGDAARVCEEWDEECGQRSLVQPLDFVALTDHAEFLGTFQGVCEDPRRTSICRALGNYIRDNVASFVDGQAPVDPEVVERLLGEPDAAGIWNDIRQTADENYRPCEFTTLHAYEFSPLINGSMMHRNVLFIGDQSAPPISSADVQSEWDLFDLLDASCGSRDDCDYLTIPPNPNFSSGRMFLPSDRAGRGGGPMTRADASLRARADVLVEITQHKGASECMAGLGASGMGGEEIDALCRFETVRPVCTGAVEDPFDCVPASERLCTSITGDLGEAASPADCTVPADMVRGALLEGLRIERELGVNPFLFGLVGATDTHNGTPGATDEAAFEGHGGILDNEPEEALGFWDCAPDEDDCGAPTFDRGAFPYNPGGLTAVYATQNTREAVFEALQARRTYATSGPRILVRTYATREPPVAEACDRLGSPDFTLEGVPMGGTITDGSGPPSIVVWAAQAAGDSVPGAPLERIQIVKGWLDLSGAMQVRVFDVAGSDDSPAPSHCSRVQPEPDRAS